MTDNSQKVFNVLPTDGSKMSGGKIKERLSLSSVDFDAAKKELKEAGLVTLGRGRGGTMSRVEGAEAPEIEIEKTPSDRLEVAREVKRDKSRRQREIDRTKAQVLEVGRRRYPYADELKVGLYNGEWYVEVWEGREATNYFIPEYEWAEVEL